MKIILISAGILAMASLGLYIALRAGSAPLTAEQVKGKIQKLIETELQKKADVSGAVVLLESEKYGLNTIFTAGTANGEPVMEDTPFHTASIGKTFTAVLAGTFIDEGKLSLEDRIKDQLPRETLAGLFEIDNTDYSDKVTVAMLLNHTSGAADYFEDPVTGTSPIQEQILSNPGRFWTPSDLLDYSRNYQKPISPPGESFHYSDTGYILLGLILEKLSGQSFDALLHERIFIPAGMDDSCLMFYSEPLNGRRPVGDIWLNGTKVNTYRSLSIDWAGGGIITTVKDLKLFLEALKGGRLITMDTLSTFQTFDHKYMKGIAYGMGFMEFRFGEYFPTLKTLPKLKGHMGILGTQMLYDGETGTTFICSFGSSSYSGNSVRAMIKILSLLSRIKS